MFAKRLGMRTIARSPLGFVTCDIHTRARVKESVRESHSRQSERDKTMSRKVVTHRGKTRYKYTPVVPQSRSRLSRLRLGTPRRLPFRESPRLSRGRARGRVSVSRSFIYIYTQREKTSAHRGGFHACFSVQIGSTFDTFYGTNLHTLERRLIVSDTHT